VDRAALEAACPGCSIEPAKQPDALVVDALAQLRSLVAVSLIAVLVGIFIVYNTVAVTVLDRLKEIGTLRAIGATRSDIVRALLTEWAIVGVLGSVAGIAGGWALAKAMLRLTAGTINALTQVADVRETVLKPETLVIGLLLGTVAALAAAWVPVRRALARPPVDVLRAHALRRNQSYLGVFRLGALCLVLGVLLIWVLRRYLAIGIASTALFFLGLALVLPQLTIWIARWLRPLLARVCRVEGFLAADNTAKFPQRTALTVTALGGSLAMMVASATLIEGFREQSQRWLDRALPFDLAVSSVDFVHSVYASTSFPGEIEDEVRKQPCVGMCYGVRTGFCDVDGWNVMVVAVEVTRYAEAQARHPSRHGTHRFSDPAVRDALLAGDGLVISDNYARLYGAEVGDSVSVATRAGPRRLKVIEIVEEYSWPRGVVFMDLAQYRLLFGDTTLNFVDVLLKPGQDRDAARAQLVEAVAGESLVWVFAKENIQQAAADTLDQMMALSNTQVLLAVVIGFLGILNTLLISVLQRTREVGLLRAIGMSRGQIARTVVLEALLMAVCGGVLGIAVGLGGGWYPLRLFTMHMTGYWTPAVVPWVHVFAALGLSLVIGALAAWVPARAAARLDVLSAIGYE
jgi:putative ABC transport system permease protein